MEKRLMTVVAGLALSTSMAFAQSQISGHVTSSEDGSPVIGASIKVAGTNTGTVTDIDGNFALNAPAGAKLEITYIGMNPAHVKAGKNMKIVLDPDEHSLDEVMVVAFGTQKRSAFTGSAAVVGSGEIGKAQVSNPVESLKGKVAGVQMTQVSGRPGESSKIRIRGIGTINASTDPLIVVDGVPYDGDMNTINPDDVESLTVLKDAASSALYGARGANGVVMITTKTGKTGSSSITFDAKWGSNSRAVPDYKYINNAAGYYETWYTALNNYALNTLKYDANNANLWANKNLTADNAFGLGMSVFQAPAGEVLIGTNGKMNPNATMGRVVSNNGQQYYVTADDWVDAMFRNSLRQEYNISAQGANEKGNFMLSFNYLNNEGITFGSGFERYSARLKSEYKIKDWLKVGANVNFAHYANNQSGVGDEGSSGSSGNVFAFVAMAPIYPLYIRDAQGNIMMHEASGTKLYDYGDASINGQKRAYIAQSNPLAANQLDEYKVEGNNFNMQGTVEVRLPLDVTFTSINNAYVDEYRTTRTTNPYFGQYASSNGMVYKNHERYFNYNLQQRLNWAHEFGEHSVALMLGHEYYNQSYAYLYGSKSNQYSPSNDELAGAVLLNSTNSYTREYNNEGYFGRVQYDYNDLYFFDASLRRDASSRFAKENRWGTFYSLGASWVINKEKFFNVDWVDDLKLKVSYGQVGNDNIESLSLGYYHYTTNYDIVNSNGSVSLVPVGRYGNRKITWETTGEFNVGVDFGLFKNRLNGTFEFYSRKTTDMLFNFSLPQSFGYTGYYDNVGDMINNGLELTLNGDIIRTRDFVWSANMNITYNHNYVSYLPDAKKTLTVDGVQGYTNGGYFIGEGEPMYNYYLHKYAGVDHETGEALYYKNVKDENGNVTGLTTTKNSSESDYYLCGTALADVFGGFGTSVSYKGFDFSVDFMYQIGGQIYDNDYASAMNANGKSMRGMALHEDILNAWTPENKNSNIPRLQYGDSYMASQSDRFLTNASYLSLQNINLGYTFPKAWISKLNLSNLRIYAQANNVWVWSKRQGLDPRTSLTAANASYYPGVRTITGGITLTF